MQQDADPSTRPEQPPDSTFTINRVGIRVPPFWSEKPTCGSRSSRVSLLRRTSRRTQQNFTTSSHNLITKHAAEVADVITNPHPPAVMKEFKQNWLDVCYSEEQRVRQLLMHEEMGDRRPTQFLRHLRTLTGPPLPSDFLRTLWTNRLPPDIQAITVTQTEFALDDVAQLADKIAEVTPPPCVARVSSSGVDICTLTARTDELARQVAALSASPSRQRSPSQIRRNARLSSRLAGRSPAPDICWYNRCFKERAKRCTAPCKWQQGNMDGSRQWRRATATTQPATSMWRISSQRRASWSTPAPISASILVPVFENAGQRLVMRCSQQMALLYVPTVV